MAVTAGTVMLRVDVTALLSTVAVPEWRFCCEGQGLVVARATHWRFSGIWDRQVRMSFLGHPHLDILSKNGFETREPTGQHMKSESLFGWDLYLRSTSSFSFKRSFVVCEDVMQT